MSIAAHTTTNTTHQAVPPFARHSGSAPLSLALAGVQVIRRNGTVVGFDPGKITTAMSKAFLAVESR